MWYRVWLRDSFLLHFIVLNGLLCYSSYFIGLHLYITFLCVMKILIENTTQLLLYFLRRFQLQIFHNNCIFPKNLITFRRGKKYPCHFPFNGNEHIYFYTSFYWKRRVSERNYSKVLVRTTQGGLTPENYL